MDLAIRQLHPLFVAEVSGADLSRDVDLATRNAVAHAMDEYAVCVLPDQNIDKYVLSYFSRFSSSTAPRYSTKSFGQVSTAVCSAFCAGARSPRVR